MGRNGHTGPVKPSSGRSEEERGAAFLALRIERGLDKMTFQVIPQETLSLGTRGHTRAALTATGGV